MTVGGRDYIIALFKVETGAVSTSYLRIVRMGGAPAHHSMTFSSLSALIMNCDATAASNKPMMRVVIFMAMGLSH